MTGQCMQFSNVRTQNNELREQGKISAYIRNSIQQIREKKKLSP
jgi:hypothetical protein